VNPIGTRAGELGLGGVLPLLLGWAYGSRGPGPRARGPAAYDERATLDCTTASPMLWL